MSACIQNASQVETIRASSDLHANAAAHPANCSHRLHSASQMPVPPLSPSLPSGPGHTHTAALGAGFVQLFNQPALSTLATSASGTFWVPATSTSPKSWPLSQPFPPAVLANTVAKHEQAKAIFKSNEVASIEQRVLAGFPQHVAKSRRGCDLMAASSL